MKRNHFNPQITADELADRNRRIVGLLETWDREPDIECSPEEVARFETEIDNAGVHFGEPNLPNELTTLTEPKIHAPVA